jgi:hypothetical protein
MTAGVTVDVTLGEILLAVGAVIAALLASWIAAWTADRRLTQTLTAESERLEDQLAHDRKMRDLEEIRAVLDDAAIAISNAIDDTIKARTRLQLTPETPEDWAEAQAQLRAARTSVFALGGIHQRLALRLGRDYPVCLMFLSVQEALAEKVGALGPGTRPLTAADLTQIDRWQDEAARRNHGFIDLCQTQIQNLAVDPYVPNPGG